MTLHASATLYISIAVSILIIIFIAYYTKKPYPKWLINQMNEPLNRFIFYFAIYLVSYYNFTVALLLLFAILTINLDYNNLISNL